jgi:hypothetical protein
MSGNDSNILLMDAESFGFVYNYIWIVANERKVALNIPDTILFKEGRPFRWLFTTRHTGEVMKKKSENLCIDEVILAFKKKITAAQKDNNGSTPSLATLWYLESDMSVRSCYINELQLCDLLSSGSHREILAIQSYVKGRSLKANGTFEHKIALKSGRTVDHETYELFDSIIEERPSTIYTSGARKLMVTEQQHEMIKTAAKRLLKHLERVTRVTISSMTIQVSFSATWTPIFEAFRSVALQHAPQVFATCREAMVFPGGSAPLPLPRARLNRSTSTADELALPELTAFTAADVVDSNRTFSPGNGGVISPVHSGRPHRYLYPGAHENKSSTPISPIQQRSSRQKAYTHVRVSEASRPLDRDTAIIRQGDDELSDYLDVLDLTRDGQSRGQSTVISDTTDIVGALSVHAETDHNSVGIAVDAAQQRILQPESEISPDPSSPSPYSAPRRRRLIVAKQRPGSAAPRVYDIPDFPAPRSEAAQTDFLAAAAAEKKRPASAALPRSRREVEHATLANHLSTNYGIHPSAEKTFDRVNSAGVQVAGMHMVAGLPASSYKIAAATPNHLLDTETSRLRASYYAGQLTQGQSFLDSLKTAGTGTRRGSRPLSAPGLTR